MILVLVEPGELSLEAVTFARRLGEVEAVAFGSAPEGLGVSRVHIVALDEYAPAAWAQSLAGLIESLAPEAVVAAGSDRGQEVMAHLAVKLDEPMAANCIAADARRSVARDAPAVGREPARGGAAPRLGAAR